MATLTLRAAAVLLLSLAALAAYQASRPRRAPLRPSYPLPEAAEDDGLVLPYEDPRLTRVLRDDCSD